MGGGPGEGLGRVVRHTTTLRDCLGPHFCQVLKSYWDVLQMGKGIKPRAWKPWSPARRVTRAQAGVLSILNLRGGRAGRVVATVASNCAGGQSMTPLMDLDSINLFKALTH